jgi:hypothetical protein
MLVMDNAKFVYERAKLVAVNVGSPQVEPVHIFEALRHGTCTVSEHLEKHLGTRPAPDGLGKIKTSEIRFSGASSLMHTSASMIAVFGSITSLHLLRVLSYDDASYARVIAAEVQRIQSVNGVVDSPLRDIPILVPA